MYAESSESAMTDALISGCPYTVPFSNYFLNLQYSGTGSKEEALIPGPVRATCAGIG